MITFSQFEKMTVDQHLAAIGKTRANCHRNTYIYFILTDEEEGLGEIGMMDKRDRTSRPIDEFSGGYYVRAESK